MYFVDRKDKTQRPCERLFIFQLRGVKFGDQADHTENTCIRSLLSQYSDTSANE